MDKIYKYIISLILTVAISPAIAYSHEGTRGVELYIPVLNNLMQPIDVRSEIYNAEDSTLIRANGMATITTNGQTYSCITLGRTRYIIRLIPVRIIPLEEIKIIGDESRSHTSYKSKVEDDEEYEPQWLDIDLTDETADDIRISPIYLNRKKKTE